MLKSYFIIALRNLNKSRTFSVIHVLGLATGMAAACLILSYIGFQTSYDTFHQDSNRIYRVNYTQKGKDDKETISAKNFIGLRPMIKDHLADIESVTAFSKIPANTGFLFRYGEKMFYEYGPFFHADSSFFKVFPTLLKKGNPNTALRDPSSLVLSEKVARKIFGEEDPINKFLDGYQVTGVLKDLPENSHFDVSFIAPLDKSWELPENYWEGPYRYTYVKLKSPVSAASVTTKLNHLLQDLNTEQPFTAGVTLSLQPIQDIHLNSQRNDELKSNGSRRLVYILMAIAMVILSLAWMNYMNMETARLLMRAKEVGVRRIIGSGKWDLSVQFLVEFFCLNAIALALAGLLIKLSLPRFSHLTGIPTHAVDIFPAHMWWPALGIFVVGSLFVGAYPSILLAKINLVSALKGKLTGTGKRSTFTKGLVVFQFTVSAVLIAFVLIIYSQMDLLQTTNKNVDLEQVVFIRNPTAYSSLEEQHKGEGGYQNFMTLKNKLLQNPAVKSVSSSSAIPGVEIGFTYVDKIKRNPGDPYDPTRYKVLFVDYNFIPVYNLKLKAGRNYSTESGNDENWDTIILNEKAMRILGFASAEEAVGQEINFMALEAWNKYKIIGIVEDYYHEAPKKEISPMIIFLNHNKGQQVYYSLRLNAGSNAQEAITSIARDWKEIFPQKPFEYSFLDDFYDQQFKFESQFGKLFTSFAVIAILIGCLGILGLTLFEANTRVREISVRKVLGASATALILLLSRTHLRMVILSAIISAPLIYLIGSEWLSGYPIRIRVSALFFFIPAGFTLAMVAVTSCFQTLKAIRTNPIDHLKQD
jgi:putative ABC transport system permease protein